MTKDGALNRDLDTPTPGDKRAIASAEATKAQVDGIKKKLASGEKAPAKEKKAKAPAPEAAKAKADAPAKEAAEAPAAAPAKAAAV